MFCKGCGKPIKETSKFCVHCGRPVEPASAASAEPTPAAPVQAAPAAPAQAAPVQQAASAAPARKKRSGVTVALIAAVVVLAAAVGVLIFFLARGGDSSAGGDETPSAPAAEPVLDRVEADSFPEISVTLRCSDPSAFSVGGVRVTEDGVDRPITGSQTGADSVTFCFLADESGPTGGEHTFTYTVEQQGRTYTGSGSYVVPSLASATVKLVSTDVSDYPVIRAYFRVTDANGRTVPGLDSRSFVIQESVQGGAYLAREIRSAGSLDRQGLNIDLLADKSGSMRGSNMEDSRRVMTEFVNSLDYAKGDKVEILAFDDIVQQMCYYTGERGLLANGIRNMSAEGGTALYIALHDGIRNAALQGGARCVIAFTDGEDTEGRYTPEEIIRYANDSQVPVYIVGVSGAREDILRPIAEGTGGRYWSIHALGDLGRIYTEIYAEQQELYMVEYLSDAGADPYSYRELDVNVSGSGCRGRVSAGFTPVRSVGNRLHTSRYELIKECLTWEQASQRCQEMGGHLVTITSQAEEQEIIAMAEANGVKYLWIGGYTSYDASNNVFAHWVTGEPVSYSNWTPGEPSRQDQDGEPEWYMMLWYVRQQWSWNDQRNDPAGAVPSMAKDMGFVCEFES